MPVNDYYMSVAASGSRHPVLSKMSQQLGGGGGRKYPSVKNKLYYLQYFVLLEAEMCLSAPSAQKFIN